jgi:hypothetical protein
MMLGLVQRGLETLYRVSTGLDVGDYVVDEQMRDTLSGAHGSREQLLVKQDDDALELALYVDPAALANLLANDPRRRLDHGNLGDFLLAVEGVSHFVMLTWRAHQERPVSALELELQAEVDKYVTCLLTAGRDLREVIFRRFEYVAGLADDERERYRVANENAAAYADALHDRFVARGDVPAMIDELRRFYRLGLADKLQRIRAA